MQLSAATCFSFLDLASDVKYAIIIVCICKKTHSKPLVNSTKSLYCFVWTEAWDALKELIIYIKIMNREKDTCRCRQLVGFYMIGHI